MRPIRRRAGASFAQLFPQLFLIPLLLVTVGVLVYLFFVASAKDLRSIEQILSDMESGGAHSRKQDAYALAQRVMERAGQSSEPEYFSARETSLLIGLLDRYPVTEKDPDVAFVRAYVIKTLGRAGQPAQSFPVLAGLASTDTGSAGERIAVLQALGFTRAPEAVEPLLEALGRARGDWQKSLTAIGALVQIVKYREDVERAPIALEMRKSLGDPQRELAWNTAYYLAEYFGDGSGAGILRNLLDPEFLDRQKGDHQRTFSDREKQTWMLHAVKGLWRVDPAEVRGRLDAIREVAKERLWTEVLDELDRLTAPEATPK